LAVIITWSGLASTAATTHSVSTMPSAARHTLVTDQIDLILLIVPVTLVDTGVDAVIQ
jgi:hypothetical protein